MLLLLLFILLSFQKLSGSYNNFINYILHNTIFYQKKDFLTQKLSSNLNLLLNNYYFLDNNKLVLKEEKSYIYIYNTHDKEKYNDNTTVLDASNMLSNNLKKLGIDSIVEEDQVSNYVNLNLTNYQVSKKFIEKIKDEENILYYIDIHRDSVNNTTLVINGKSYAKILFVLGLDNPNYYENKKNMEKMNNYLNQHYPGVSKGILEKKGSGVDGVYNQDIDKNVILIEIGGVENNYDEVNNSTEIIALMLYHIIGDEI